MPNHNDLKSLSPAFFTVHHEWLLIYDLKWYDPQFATQVCNELIQKTSHLVASLRGQSVFPKEIREKWKTIEEDLIRGKLHLITSNADFSGLIQGIFLFQLYTWALFQPNSQGTGSVQELLQLYQTKEPQADPLVERYLALTILKIRQIYQQLTGRSLPLPAWLDLNTVRFMFLEFEVSG